DMREIRYVDALNEALREELTRDENVYIIGEDVAQNGGVFGVTMDLWKDFGNKRVRNTPISEAAIIGCGVGSAVTGLRPVVELMYTDFTTVCMDQIVNQAAKIRYMFGGKAVVPLTIRCQSGAGSGDAAQHTQCLESWFTHVPGLKVVMPSTPADAKGLLKSSIRENNPVIFIEHQMLYSTKGQVPDGEYSIPLGKAEVKREGKDLTLVTWSWEVLHALKAAEVLAERGIDVEVVDPRTLDPFDWETVGKSIEKTGRLLIVHQACRTSGFGAEVAAESAEKFFYSLDGPIVRLAAANTPVPYNRFLEAKQYPQTEDIVTQVEKMMMV
ncbi:MAG: alpha-ketoacid dehydrogenase subunit beta, partial [Bacteroidales bacterium]|nr:alpha-ketoacid dehydrogenase subunit beta [Bacteroidales bacterium]